MMRLFTKFAEVKLMSSYEDMVAYYTNHMMQQMEQHDSAVSPRGPNLDNSPPSSLDDVQQRQFRVDDCNS